MEGMVSQQKSTLAGQSVASSRRFEIGEHVYRIYGGNRDLSLTDWQAWCPEFCETHFVQRVTAQRVYVEALFIFGERPYILSRKDLERRGYTFGRDYTLFFVSMPEAYRKLTIGYARSEPARVVLELPETFTQEELTKAYRRKAMATHPDRGGSAEEFRAVQAAYEQLKA